MEIVRFIQVDENSQGFSLDVDSDGLPIVKAQYHNELNTFPQRCGGDEGRPQSVPEESPTITHMCNKTITSAYAVRQVSAAVFYTSRKLT